MSPEPSSQPLRWWKLQGSNLTRQQVTRGLLWDIGTIASALLCFWNGQLCSTTQSTPEGIHPPDTNHVLSENRSQTNLSFGIFHSNRANHSAQAWWHLPLHLGGRGRWISGIYLGTQLKSHANHRLSLTNLVKPLCCFSTTGLRTQVCLVSVQHLQLAFYIIFQTEA